MTTLSSRKYQDYAYLEKGVFVFSGQIDKTGELLPQFGHWFTPVIRKQFYLNYLLGKPPL